MRTVSLEELLEAGCHFGHQVIRHNPKSRDFLFEARDNVHIIDLAKTKEGLEAAAGFIKDLSYKRGSLLVVGTKRQARGIIEENIKRAYSSGEAGSGQAQNDKAGDSQDRLFYITTRWIGGIMTNFLEIAKNSKKLKDLTVKLQNEEEKAKYTKKEIGLWEKERVKLYNFYHGVEDMKKIPDALFIIDIHNEELAVREANKMGVTTIGIVDTNSDPSLVDYPIPANDDAVGSIKVITNYIIDAWIEGSKSKKEEPKAQVKEEKTEKKAIKKKTKKSEKLEK